MDLAKALKGFTDIAKQSAAADPQAAKALEQSPDMAQVEKFLSDPSFTLDVAKSDGTLRRVAAETELEGVPGGGKIAFSVQFKDVGKPVRSRRRRAAARSRSWARSSARSARRWGRRPPPSPSERPAGRRRALGRAFSSA